MKVTIETIKNGYILRIGNETEVFEESDSEEECFSHLATRLSEFFVKPYDKFGSDNIRISWDRPGHKVESGDEENLESGL